MTYDSSKGVLGKDPFTVVGLVADKCKLEAGKSFTNLLTYSEEFDNSGWGKGNVTIAANAITAPDGTLTADKIIENTVTGNHQITQSFACVVGTTYTYSVHFKAGENDSLIMYCAAVAFNDSGMKVYLNTGTVSVFQNASEVVNSGIEDIGDGWYRAWMSDVANSTGTGTFYVRFMDSSGAISYTGDGVSGLYVSGGQLVEGSEPGHYVKTTSTSATLACTATETGDAKCFNTRKTCNATASYFKVPFEVKFCLPRSNLPIGEPMLPALDGEVRIAPTSVTAGKGLGNRSVGQAKIKDFPHHDRGIDPYFNERTYDAETTGTFWGKWLARNPYFEGRTLKVYHGYINSPFSFNDFNVYEYDITDISGPDNGAVNITFKDVLIRTYKEKSQYPVKSLGELSADIAAGAGTATLVPAGIGSSYPASGTLSIGKEAITFTRSTDTLTLTARAQYGTEAKDHKEGDAVQLCATWSNTNVVDVLYELLVTGAGLPTSYIPYDDGATGTPENWDDELLLWLGTSLVNGILMKPEGIEKIIGELSRDFMFDIWWDALTQKVKIKALSPEPSGVTINTLTEGYNILKDSVKIKRDATQRISQVQVWYSKIDFSENDDIENFGAAKIAADVSLPTSDLYGSEAITVITSRWINNLAQASTLSGRLLARFSDTPEIIEFEVGAKDDTKFYMAGRVEINSWQFQGFTGANESKKFQVLEINENEPGHKVKVTALTSSFSGRYFFIAPDGTPDYSSATDEQKAAYGFICLDTGLFADGTAGYKII
jgi:hypothetical protein